MPIRSALLTALLLAPAALLAQAPDQNPAPPPPGAQGPQRQTETRIITRGPGGDRSMDFTRDSRGRNGAPTGTWWKDPNVAKKIELTADQGKRIDDIFVKSRIQLIRLHAGLEEAELLLEPLMNANPVDTGKAGTQIDKIADLRAGLEKANARMLLDIRAVLSATQWTKLQEDRRTMHRDMMRGPGGMSFLHGIPGEDTNIQQP